MHQVVDAGSRARALRERAQAQASIEARIERAIASGKIVIEDEELSAAPAGCASKLACLLPWMRTGRQRVAREEAVGVGVGVGSGGASRARTAMDARLFGQQKVQESAADKLSHAAENVAAHVEALSDKASLSRARAQQLMGQGKKSEALMALKKAKALEKQLETAQSTHVALETQVDVLAQSELQKQVASALSASVATTKKKTKGLLGRTETAVEDAAELKDLAEDISSAMGGLSTEVFDDDELMEELMAMSEPAARPQQQQQQQGLVTKAVRFAEATPAGAAEAVVGVDVSSFPAAPTRLPEAEAEEERTALASAVG
jgi:hypothetical protein